MLKNTHKHCTFGSLLTHNLCIMCICLALHSNKRESSFNRESIYIALIKQILTKYRFTVQFMLSLFIYILPNALNYNQFINYKSNRKHGKNRNFAYNRLKMVLKETIDSKTTEIVTKW